MTIAIMALVAAALASGAPEDQPASQIPPLPGSGEASVAEAAKQHCVEAMHDYCIFKWRRDYYGTLLKAWSLPSLNVDLRKAIEGSILAATKDGLTNWERAHALYQNHLVKEGIVKYYNRAGGSSGAFQSNCQTTISRSGSYESGSVTYSSSSSCW